MAAAAQTVPALLTLDEYLHTSYRPDCDFVDGHLEERTMGTPKHARLQMQLGYWFVSHSKDWDVIVMGDVRTRTTATRVRLPDVAIVTKKTAELDERWITSPPLIAIEILSPDDQIQRVLIRLEEFRCLGVQNVWLFDPIARTVQTYTEDGLQLAAGPRLAVPNSPIYLDLPELFASLD